MRRGTGGFVFLFLFGLLFAVVGGFVGFYFGKPLIDEAKASESWPTVQGSVTESQLESHTDDGSTTYSVHVIYEYTVQGQQLDSDRVWFGGDYSTSDRSGMQKIVRDYPIGKQVTVYYSPDDPTESVLLPGAYFSTYIIFVVGMVFLVAGAVMLLIPVGKIVLSVARAAGTGDSEADSMFRVENTQDNSFSDADNVWRDRFPEDGR